MTHSCRNRLRAAHSFGHATVECDLILDHLMSQSPSSGALIRTRHRRLRRVDRLRVAIAFERRTHSDAKGTDSPLSDGISDVAIAFERRTHSDCSTHPLPALGLMSQSPSSGALIRTVRAVQQRPQQPEARRRNRLRAAHSFGRHVLPCSDHECHVAIAFERRTHSDSGHGLHRVLPTVEKVAIAFERRTHSDWLLSYPLATTVVVCGSRNRLRAAHSFGLS